MGKRQCILTHNKCIFFKKSYLFFREEGEEERERNIYVQEKHHLVASHTPLVETQSTTQACALTGNRTGDLLVHRLVLNPLSHTSQGTINVFLKNNTIFMFYTHYLSNPPNSPKRQILLLLFPFYR